MPAVHIALNGPIMRENMPFVGSVFNRVWPVGDGSHFDGLLSAIDEAVIRHRSLARLDRVHRRLERLYPS